MMSKIDAFDIKIVPAPLGRVIGDNSCSYDQIVILTVALKTNEGSIGYGYSELMTTGTFQRPAWWVTKPPDELELRQIMLKEWWPVLMGKSAIDTRDIRYQHRSSDFGLDRAIRLALWDLIGKDAGMPLHKILGGPYCQSSKTFYGSPLDFPLSEEETEFILRKFLKLGATTIKVKIGAQDINRDIERLKFVKSVVGEKVILTADGNEAWDWKTTLGRLEEFDAAGIQFEYLEDPLYRDDFKGIKELTSRSSTPIIGHDYLRTIEDIEKLVDAGIHGLRTFKDFDYIIDCVAIAKRHGLPVYIGNSLFESSVHAAVAFPEINRIEFADLGWNDLVKNPIRFENGLAIAPDQPGHGFELKDEYWEVLNDRK